MFYIFQKNAHTTDTLLLTHQRQSLKGFHFLQVQLPFFISVPGANTPPDLFGPSRTVYHLTYSRYASTLIKKKRNSSFSLICCLIRTLPHDSNLKVSNNLFDGQCKWSAETWLTIPRNHGILKSVWVSWSRPKGLGVFLAISTSKNFLAENSQRKLKLSFFKLQKEMKGQSLQE